MTFQRVLFLIITQLVRYQRPRPNEANIALDEFLIDKNDVLGLSRLQFEVNGFYMQVSDMIKLMK